MFQFSFPEVTKAYYFTGLGIIVAAYSVYLIISTDDRQPGDHHRSSMLIPILMAAFLTIWMGNRDPMLGIYGDSYNYNFVYNNVQTDETSLTSLPDFSSEWLWDAIMYICKLSGLDVNGWFTVIAFLYTFSAVWAAGVCCPRRPTLATLLIFASFSFLSFGLNGLRNGVACHMVILAISYYLDDRRIIAGVLAFLILGIHRSSILPITAAIAAVTVLKNPRHVLYIWIASIPVSLLFGETLTAMIMNLGFDDRMVQYGGSSLSDENEFSHTGFRWDFLIYGAIPIVFYWYVTFIKGVRDGWYNVIAITYMLSNAFWIIVIRATFSNRFAYLSWFLMPIMIAYPLSEMRFVDKRDTLAALILPLYLGLSITLLIGS